jgi:hypothetical protein
MADLARADLLRPKIERFEIAAGSIFIRALSAGFAVSLRGKSLGDAEIFDLIARSVCSEDGTPILSAADVAEIDLATMQAIVDEIMRFNALAPGSTRDLADALKKTREASGSISSSP